MNTAMPSTGSLHLIVGYDGSAPATRALDSAAALLAGRDGIHVVYVPHMPAVDMLSPDAVAGMETTFDEIARDLHAQASEQGGGGVEGPGGGGRPVVAHDEVQAAR